MMENLRKYGAAPFAVAVIHGGPGAAGEMAPVARHLVAGRGVLEPLQTATSLDGQVAELKAVLEANANPPLVLIGYSWGAWLGFILAARHPALVKRLILVASGPFEDKYAAGILETRLGRLTADERAEVQSLMAVLGDPTADNKSPTLARFGALLAKADAYDPLPDEPAGEEVRGDIFEKVWPQAAELRRSGALLALGRSIQCPVTAIHGDHDPHPADGVRIPLSAVLPDFQFVLLPHCGHRPWVEKQAIDGFYRAMDQALSDSAESFP